MNGSRAAYTRGLVARRKAIVATFGLPETVKHGRSAYVNWGCRCEVCSSAQKLHNITTQERSREGRIDHVRGGIASGCPCDKCKSARNRLAQTRNAESRSRASNHRLPWSGAELEMLTRSDVSITELAEKLGRSWSAVQRMRSRVASEPKFARYRS